MNTGFQTHLKAEDLPDGRTRKLLEPLIFICASGMVLTVPKGFESDGASVPKVFQNIVSRWGKHGSAAVLHDYLYKCGVFSKRECDVLFLDAMLISGVWKIRAYSMYYAVAGGGRDIDHAADVTAAVAGKQRHR